MIKYIIEILKLQNSIILPGFGSLQINNTKTGKVVFNPLLKFNDGTLAKYIAQKEGIDQQSAQNQVAKFIREIEAEISKGNSFDMFQFGRFVKNKKGDVEFIQEGSPADLATDAKKTTTAKETKKPEVKPVEKKPAPKDDTKAATEVKPPVTAPEKKTIPVKEDEKPAVKPEPKHTEKKPQEKIASAEPEKEPVKKHGIPDEKATISVQPEHPTPEKEPVKKHGIPDEKPMEKPAESAESKQNKNTFTPVSGERAASSQPEEKPAAKMTEINKNIPVAEGSKKEPAAQEKNKFVPPVEEAAMAKATDLRKNEPKVMAASEKVIEETGDGKVKKEKFKKDKPQKVKHEVPKEKKKSRWMRILIILIILGGGAAAGWFYRNEISGFLYAGVGGHDKDSTATSIHHEDPDTLTASHEVSEEIIDTTVTDHETVEEPVTDHQEDEQEPEPVHETPQVDHSSPGGSYHIIGNSFSSKTNADNYAEKMSSKGYPATVLGKFDNLYLVSLKSYGSREDAKAGLGSVQSDAASAWVFKYK